ncbi:hypothetical protein ACLBOM_10640 [Escherichia coli]
MLVKIKRRNYRCIWQAKPSVRIYRQINTERQGTAARGVDDADQLRAFVVSEDRMKQAFGSLRHRRCRWATAPAKLHATLARLIQPTGSACVGHILRSCRIHLCCKMSDATLARLIRPTDALRV